MLVRRKERQTVPLGLSALVLVLLLSAFLIAPGASAQPGYTVVTNPNATRTVNWNLSDPSGFTRDNVTLRGGKAELSLVNQSLTWSGGSPFAANGTLDANLTAATDGLELVANQTNHVPDGDFATPGPWSYADSADGNVSAAWEPGAGRALLGHASNSTQVLWDGLDTNPSPNWGVLAIGNCSGMLSNVTGNSKQGPGMFRMYLNVTDGCTYVGMQNTSASVNWSAYDALLIWVNLTSQVPMGFNLSAIENSRTYFTTTQSLSSGWHEVEVNLTPLGTTRRQLSAVTFRFMPGATGFFTVYLDDIRVARNLVFNGSASITQTLVKANVTSAEPGSAQLTFDWQWTNRSGIESADAAIRLAGPFGFLRYPLSTGTLGAWSHAQVDVSADVAAAGDYNVSLTAQISADTTAAVQAQLLIDNITLLFPDRQNGTYVSRAIDLGTNNILTNASMRLALPPGTDVNLTLSGALQPNPYGSVWDFNLSWNGSAPLDLHGLTARFVKITARLTTTNQSQTPALQGFVLTGRHYPLAGTVTTRPFTADGAFLFWSGFNAVDEVLVAPQDTNVQYYLNAGSGWLEVFRGEAIPHYTSPTIQLRVVLRSMIGWLTPSLDALSVTYDFMGPLVAVHVSSSNRTVVSGGTLQLTATAVDAGDHANQSVFFQWSLDNPGSSVDSTGVFRAGAPGVYNVTASALGVSQSLRGTIELTVLPSVTPASTFPMGNLIVGLGILALVAGLGYAVFEFGVRRAFAIDDFFLIARDGRLMSHNTRRLLPDQDEDTLSGMLTAINSFVRDAWREENGHIRRMVFGGKTTLIERGTHVFLAAVYSGRVPRWATRDLKAFVGDLETHFGAAFQRWSGSPEDLQQLREVMGRFASHMRYSRRRVWRAVPRAT